MKNILRIAVLMTSSAALMTGCGESYQAIYSGEATVAQMSCGGIPKSTYSIDVQYSSSSPDLTLTVTNFLPKGSSAPDTTYNLIAGTQINAQYTNGETSFSVQNETFGDKSPDTVSASGTLSPDKTQISSFSYTRNSFVAGTNTPCMLQVNAVNLVKKQ